MSDYEPSRIFAIMLQVNRLMEKAMIVCTTDPSTYRCVTEALKRCHREIEDCLETEGAPPKCPPGWGVDNGQCVPPGS